MQPSVQNEHGSVCDADNADCENEVKKTVKRVRKRKIEGSGESEALRIPLYEDYGIVKQKDYNVSQLKEICRHYKTQNPRNKELKVGGNKEQLFRRVQSFLEQSHNASILQCKFKRVLAQLWFKSHGPALLDRAMCVNEDDLMGSPLDEISVYQFFSFEENGCVYGFDLATLITMIKKGRRANPYTRQRLPGDVIRNLNLLTDLSVPVTGRMFVWDVEEVEQGGGVESENHSVVAVGSMVDGDEGVEQSTNGVGGERGRALQAMQALPFEQRVNNVFVAMDEHGHYTNVEWFLNMGIASLRRFVQELKDIFEYRAGLQMSVRRAILPTWGGVLQPPNTRLALISLDTLELLRELALRQTEMMVCSGVTEGDRALGTLYVLSALTLGSSGAAEAMPWLYESVLH